MAADPSDVLKNFVIDGGDRSVQDIVSKLKFISKIKPEEKMDVATLALNENTIITSIHRTLLSRGESRATTLEFIRATIGEAFDISSRYMKRDEYFFRGIGKMVLESLKEINIGLENLKETYKTDRMFISRIETLQRTLDAKLNDSEHPGPPPITHTIPAPPITYTNQTPVSCINQTPITYTMPVTTPIKMPGTTPVLTPVSSPMTGSDDDEETV